MKTDIPKPEVTLPPNSVTFITMDLEARKPKLIESLKAVKVKAEVAVQLDDKSDFYVPFEYNVAPLRRYELKASGSIKVDGRLQDWKELPYALPTTEGAQFGITYDDNFFYLGIRVKDREIMANSNEAAINQDFVGFVFDGQPIARSAADEGEGWFRNSLYFITTPEDGTGKNATRDMSDEEKALSWKCIRDKEGYAFEIAIPVSYVDKLQGTDWQTVRINVIVQDKDSNSTTTHRITWQPNWRESGNVAGSGMFFRKKSDAKVSSSKAVE